jgi:translation elongation factor EF-Tu-like GTPase
MAKIGMFRIENSFKITGKGLVALGQIVEGRVKVGSFLTFEVNRTIVTLKIAGVDMADNISTKESWVGLTFVYIDEQQKMDFERIKLIEQLVEVSE